MGFFLLEHTTSLDDDRYRIMMTSDLTDIEKLVLSGQIYAYRLQGIFVMKRKILGTPSLAEWLNLSQRKSQ